MERGEEVESLLGGEAEDGAALADDDEGLLVRVVRVDVADGSAGELQRELPVPPGQVVTWTPQYRYFR